ncbi:unnamed protein product [Cuscuta epithymum]|uniref:Uncharacterized protein n=1 Tax=Cuscuta epithymum TaxID=186058 RepID=A0AAV0DQ69_9ASTE|nr:unnamed protein product [Cuscuta epithymum]
MATSSAAAVTKATTTAVAGDKLFFSDVDLLLFSDCSAPFLL